MKRFLFFPICTVLAFALDVGAGLHGSSERLRAHLTEIPDKDATAAELESQGDQLRAEKHYLDAMDFYLLALKRPRRYPQGADPQQAWDHPAADRTVPGSEKRLREVDQGRFPVRGSLQQSRRRLLPSKEISQSDQIL